MDNFEKLLNSSYRFLSYRPRSEKEIRDYLKKKKASNLTIKNIIQKLISNKFIDDEEFTRWWIEQRTKIKPKGVRFIKFELKQKGIDKDLIEKVFEDSSEEIITDFEKALNLAQRRMTRYKNEEPRKRYEKLARFLASKGFDFDVIKKVIDQVLGKEYN